MVALGLLLFGVSLLSLQDSLIKLFAPQTSFWQLQLVRSSFNLLIAVGLAALAGGFHLLWPRRLGPAVARGLLLATCMLCFFGASQQITVSQMATGLYTYPLFITLLAGPVLGERIGPWRVGALMLGAAGCLLVLDPVSDGGSYFQLVPVFAGFFYACNVLVLRRYCRNESPLALAFIVAIVFMVTGSIGALGLESIAVPASLQQAIPFIFIGWPPLAIGMVGVFACFAVLNLFGNLCLSRAYQTADSSWLAPLDFVYLLFVAMWGRVLFDSWPTPLAGLGMVMIAAAGVITAIREQRHSGQSPGEPDTQSDPPQSGSGRGG